MPLPRGFRYHAGLFEPAAAAEHLAGLLAEVEWETHTFAIYGRRVAMPRLIAMYGPAGYRYSGVEHPPRPLLDRLAAICERVQAATGLRFNSVLANLYRDGRDGVSWHRDDDYVHGGQPDIASVSLGATRRFQMRDRRGRRVEIALEGGSLLVITGAALARWWHRVPKTARLAAEDLLAATGLGFGVHAGECSAPGTAALASAEDAAARVARQHACRAEQILESASPDSPNPRRGCPQPNRRRRGPSGRFRR